MPGTELGQSSTRKVPAAGVEAAMKTRVMSGVPGGGTWQKATRGWEK